MQITTDSVCRRLFTNSVRPSWLIRGRSFALSLGMFPQRSWSREKKAGRPQKSKLTYTHIVEQESYFRQHCHSETSSPYLFRKYKGSTPRLSLLSCSPPIQAQVCPSISAIVSRAPRSPQNGRDCVNEASAAGQLSARSPFESYSDNP